MLRRTLITDEPFEFEAGGSVGHLTVAYHISKERFTPGDKVIVICHALTANSDVEDWWPQLVGPGKLLDTQRYFILCVNMLGSPYGSSGPSSDRGDGRPWYFDFPKVTVRDMVRASLLVRRSLGIDHIDLLVGSSIGGFQAFEWAVQEPDIIRNIVFISTAPRVSAWVSATMEAQRMALEVDRTFRECRSLDGGKEGLKCARAQGLISYRGYKGYCLTQSEPDVDTLFAERVASYERYQGEKLAKRFDAYSYWYLCNAVDSNNVGRGRGGVEKALGGIKASTTVVSIDNDLLFPPEEGRQWAEYIPGARFRIIHSQFAHDGFLLEYEQLTEIIGPILNG